MSEAFIKAISYYLPEKVVSNEDLVACFPEWTVDKIAGKIGVSERHVAAENETAGDMAVKAAEKLFDEHNIDRGTIDFLILCTQSPDYFLPSTACALRPAARNNLARRRSERRNHRGDKVNVQSKRSREAPFCFKNSNRQFRKAQTSVSCQQNINSSKPALNITSRILRLLLNTCFSVL